MNPEPDATGSETAACPVHHGRTALHGPEFAADPHGVYHRLRDNGDLVRVELAPDTPATLVIGYQTALDVLRDPATFPKDPRPWQETVHPDCPVLPMMAYRPNCLFTDGAYHARLRAAVTDSLARVDLTVVRDEVERISDKLLSSFAADGKADLIDDYAKHIPYLILNTIFGCPQEIGDRLVMNMAKVFEGIDAENSNAMLAQAILDLIALKREYPGQDVTSWLMAHSAELTDEEVLHQIVVLSGASVEPEKNLIANTVRLLLSDDRFAGDLSGGSVPVEEALDEVLWTDPPMANYGATYPTEDLDFAGVRLRRAEPVVISFAAANTDPALASQRRAGNRAHLAWSAGPHACPAQGLARMIACAAIEKLLDGLPGMKLAVAVEELAWRPGPFHRALAALPVAFPPVSARLDQTGDTPWNDSSTRTASTPPAATSTPKPPGSVSAARQRWLHSLVTWWRGQ